MKDSNKPDLEELTNVRVSHREVSREAAASAREMTVRENGLEPISSQVIVILVLVGLIAGGVLFKDNLFNYGEHPVGYLRGVDPNAKETGPPIGDALSAYMNVGAAKFKVCAACHGPGGAGSNDVPPLDGSEWVSNYDAHVLAIAMNGLDGKITVKGKDWTKNMAPQTSGWSDFELAGLATYVRNTFGGKKGEVVSVEQVKELKKRFESRTAEGNVTEAELKSDLLAKPFEAAFLAPDTKVNKQTGEPQ